MTAALAIIASRAPERQIADAAMPEADATDVAETANVRRNAATLASANRPAHARVASARAALPPVPANEKPVMFAHRLSVRSTIRPAAAAELFDNAMN